MLSKPGVAAVALFIAIPEIASAETVAGPQRVTEVVSVKIERMKDGPNGHRITAVGKVPSAGWTAAMLRPTRERHPNNAVAGFEMVAVPPKKGAAQVVSEIAATLETTIGAIQHTLIVRGARKSVTCVMAEPISCE